MNFQGRVINWIIIGDCVCALVLSLIGFAAHYGKIQSWRWLTTFLPVLVSWFLIAPWLGNYRDDRLSQPVQAWRAALAAFLAAPMAAWLRGACLNSPIVPLFVLVLGLTDALGFLIWRVIFSNVFRRIKRNG